MPERSLTHFWFVFATLISSVFLAFLILKPNPDENSNKKILEQCQHDLGNDEGTLVLCLWLYETGIIQHFTQLQKIGLKTLGDLSKLPSNQVSEILGNPLLQESYAENVDELFSEGSNIEVLKKKASNLIGKSYFSFPWSICNNILVGIALFIWMWLFIFMALHFLRALCPETGWANAARQTILEWSRGYRARVNFDWSEPCQVGTTVTLIVEFWSDRPYEVSEGDSVSITITQGSNSIAAAVDIGEEIPNQVKASFTVRKTGQYSINISIGSLLVRGSPFIKNFVSGPADVSKTLLVRPSPIHVCTVGHDYLLSLEPKDEYGNRCSWGRDPKDVEQFSFDCKSVGGNYSNMPVFYWHWNEPAQRLILHVIFKEKGIYIARIKVKGSLINKGKFNMIVLSIKDDLLVRSSLESRSATYEVKLISLNGEKWITNRNTYCALSPKQIALKNYFLGIFPNKFATFRISLATKFTFDGSNAALESPLLTIEYGGQQKAELVSKDVHLLAATFAHYLLENIGGSEKFTDKEAFFYREIQKRRTRWSHFVTTPLRIDRRNILQSSMQATSRFGERDWCKNFLIYFNNEQGLDGGGLSREWFQLLCVNMFDKRKSGMFTSLSDDEQALVHPNPKMPFSINIKHYEFAGRIVGKCLYESSQGPKYRQLVKARFTRSFLAQLLGLRVTYKYFECDDPQLYISKIRYIEENDVSDMELTFTDEEYDNKGKLLRTVELVPNGARLSVNNENKLAYLDALAQHRLVISVKDQVNAFLRGLNELVPDNLLSIFDENELELLMCGTSEYSVSDLKANHDAIGSSPEFTKVLSWFWTALTNLGPEERSRLLQFTTGSSQVPPGGFSQLKPKFQIASSSSFGSLPIAHTCLNQICLPNYNTYEKFEKALLLAINEGSEGFAFA